MTETYCSLEEFEKNYLPKDYQKRLAKQGRVEELMAYTMKNNINFEEIMKYVDDPKTLGKLLTQITINQLKKISSN